MLPCHARVPLRALIWQVQLNGHHVEGSPHGLAVLPPTPHLPHAEATGARRWARPNHTRAASAPPARGSHCARPFC
eukprot:3306684-Prymnesium_polylepis.2